MLHWSISDLGEMELPPGQYSGSLIASPENTIILKVT